MRLTVAALIVAIGSACATPRPPIRPGPPVVMHFGPPAGNVSINRDAQIVVQSMEFPRGPPIVTRDEMRATTEERYEPAAGGELNVKTTLLEAVATHNGNPIPDEMSLVGIALVHGTDATGHFLGLRNWGDALEAINQRITEPGLRARVTPLLTPDYFAKPLERAWLQRFGTLCGRPVAPGDVFYAVDEQPVGEIGVVRTIMRSRVLGTGAPEGRPSLEIDVEYGDRDSDIARSPGAADALLAFPDGVNALTRNVHGDGRRLVDLQNCQTYSDESVLTGEGKLNQDNATQADVRLPLKVKYEAHRQVLRMTPAQAEAMAIPTTPQGTQTSAPP